MTSAVIVYHHGFAMRCCATYFCFVFLCQSSLNVLSMFWHRWESNIPLATPKCHWILVDKVLWAAGATLCQRPGKFTLPAAALLFQEEITVSWIINENKLANIKYWKGNVCMLTIRDGKRSTYLSKREVLSAKCISSYLPEISQHEEEQGVLQPSFKHCSDQ